MYSNLLKDPRWQKRRLKVFERDRWKCCCCNSTDKTLNVHHLKYHGKPWDAPDEHLETLCEECHGWRTDFDRAFGRSLVETRFWQNMVLFFEYAAQNHHKFINSHNGYSTDLLESLRLKWRKEHKKKKSVASPTVV